MNKTSEQVISFWYSQMYGSEDFGRLTAENLFNTIQRYSDHPGKAQITVEECATYMREEHAKTEPPETEEERAEREANIEEQIQLIKEIEEIDNEEWTQEEDQAFKKVFAAEGVEAAIEKVKPAKRSRGRPKQDKVTRAYTIDKKIATEIDSMPEGERSAFVNAALHKAFERADHAQKKG